MRLLCSSCERLVDVDEARRVGDEVELTCPRCQQPHRLELRASGEPEAAPIPAIPASPASPEPVCPKCRAPRGAALACPRCGLVYDRWKEGPERPPPELEARRKELEADWDDEARHARFLSACLEAGALAFAASCYRDRDDDISRQQLERLTSIGVQAMQRDEAPTRLNPKVIRLVGWVIFFALALAFILLAFTMAR